jgi:hypothetical protein
MLSFSMTIPATVPQRLEIPEGLRNYPVHVYNFHEEMRPKQLKLNLIIGSTMGFFHF